MPRSDSSLLPTCPRAARPVLLLLVLSLTAVLAACDSNENEGDFRADIRPFDRSGTIRLEGRALFSADSSDGQFTIQLVSFSNRSSFCEEGLLFARTEAGPPSPGRYPFTTPPNEALPSGPFAGALCLSFGGAAPAVYHTFGRSGELVITSVSEDRVTGNFAFSASRHLGTDSPEAVEVSGTFDAERGPTDDNFPR